MKSTPWGPSQHEEILADGIIFYSTASHGGIWLSAKRQKQLNYSDNWLKSPTWWEEDCDWAIPFAFFADDIRKHGTANRLDESLRAARETIKHVHPNFIL